ncbi:hypothetical protein phiG2_05 [Lysinibacillus phage phiG2]|nr:hypothetical protein phiG2_05 [Lysinibacillus phage phiG2]
MSAIKNLIKAHKTQAIVSDTYTLQNYLAKHCAEKGADKGKARMTVIGIETKYIPSFDINSPMYKPSTNSQGNGHRTRFTLSNGETVGTFSQAGDEFFKFFARLMGHRGDEDFLRIDIDGQIQVNVCKIELGGNKSTYEFELIEEGSELNGLTQYLPTAQEVLGNIPVIQNTAQLEAPKEEVAQTEETAK